jgi:hypothetical protein
LPQGALGASMVLILSRGNALAFVLVILKTKATLRELVYLKQNQKKIKITREQENVTNKEHVLLSHQNERKM